MNRLPDRIASYVLKIDGPSGKDAYEVDDAKKAHPGYSSFQLGNTWWIIKL